jgi:hypothetical protein
MGKFQERWFSVGFFFHKTEAIRDQESIQLNKYLDHWGWYLFLALNELISIFMTQLFYDNLQLNSDLFYATSWMFDHPLKITMKTLTDGCMCRMRVMRHILFRVGPS